MRISDWSSDVCSSDLSALERSFSERAGSPLRLVGQRAFGSGRSVTLRQTGAAPDSYVLGVGDEIVVVLRGQVSRTRSEEHTSELPSLMRISYAVFCLKKKITNPTNE